MLRLRNCLLPLLRVASPLPSPIYAHECRLLSTSPSPSPAPFSLEAYLVASCGLAPAKAREASEKASRELSRGSKRSLEELSYSRLSSASNPDAILDMLSSVGLSRADIAAVVSADPLLLRASVKNIAPRLVALRDRVGLSTPQIARFLLVKPRVLHEADVVLKLEFFISFFRSFDRVLVAAKRPMGALFSSSLERVKSNVALLNQWGVRDIAKLCLAYPLVLTSKSERVKELLLRAEELGVPPTSRMFRHAVAAVTGMSKEKVAAKLEFFKRTLGCSQSEVSTAVSKMPAILGFSDEILLRKINFLVNEAAMERRYIVERPVLFALSLEKRLVPRHYVMKVLQEKGLLNGNISFYSLAKYGEETFKSKFIDCHKDSVPGLANDYAAACAGIVPSRANTLFKRICLKLDALSHFDFAPKPVIEDMSVQANVPALAMEEIAPVAVSDAAMLAPEEIFEGKGDVKEEGELTQAERKRRANKKRKYAASHKERPAKLQKD